MIQLVTSDYAVKIANTGTGTENLITINKCDHLYEEKKTTCLLVT